MEKSSKRKIIASLHALIFIFLSLVLALSSQFTSRAWFSTNDKVDASGISVSSVRAGVFEEISYFRATETRLITVDGEKHNEYCFSYNEDALSFSLPSGNGTPERSSFSDSVSLLEHSDRSANSQLLIRVKVQNPGQYEIALTTETEEYLGNALTERTENGPYNLAPSALPLSSVVHFAILSSAAVQDDSAEQLLSLSDTAIDAADMNFVDFTSGTGQFRSPFSTLPNEKLTVTVGEDRYFYIFVDYYLPAIEDVVEKTLLYVDKALTVDPNYNDIIIGHTNLVFTVDFEFSVEEVAQ